MGRYRNCLAGRELSLQSCGLKRWKNTVIGSWRTNPRFSRLEYFVTKQAQGLSKRPTHTRAHTVHMRSGQYQAHTPTSLKTALKVSVAGTFVAANAVSLSLLFGEWVCLPGGLTHACTHTPMLRAHACVCLFPVHVHAYVYVYVWVSACLYARVIVYLFSG